MRNKILYIHGLSSSGSSSTTRNLQALLPDYSVLSPDLPVAPQEALDMLWHLCELEQPDRKSTRLNSSHSRRSRMPSSA